MRILLLGLAIPDLDDYLVMYSELMVEFKKNGHKVTIIAPATKPSHKGLRREKDIDVLRVPTLKLFNVGKFAKGLANILLPFQFKWVLKKSGLDLNFDLVVLPTPPITFSSVAKWLKSKYNSRVYLILRDIFPQNAVDLKMMSKNGLIYAYFRKKEKTLYRVSDYIGCMSQENINFVARHNPEIDTEKLHLLPNWGVKNDLLGEKELGQLRRKYELEGRFIVMFGGNIGKPQKMENIVALAESCSDYPDILFLIIGGGVEKNRLDQMVREKGLANIWVWDYLTRKGFFEVLQVADVGLISLSEDFTIPNYPSKTVTYFNAKKPVLAAIDLNTDYGRDLERIGAGLWAHARDTKALKEKLLELYQNPDLCKNMGEKGYQYMVEELQPSKAFRNLTDFVEKQGFKIKEVD